MPYKIIQLKWHWSVWVLGPTGKWVCRSNTIPQEEIRFSSNFPRCCTFIFFTICFGAHALGTQKKHNSMNMSRGSRNASSPISSNFYTGGRPCAFWRRCQTALFSWLAIVMATPWVNWCGMGRCWPTLLVISWSTCWMCNSTKISWNPFKAFKRFTCRFTQSRLKQR